MTDHTALLRALYIELQRLVAAHMALCVERHAVQAETIATGARLAEIIKQIQRCAATGVKR